jgi:hypothetical protein
MGTWCQHEEDGERQKRWQRQGIPHLWLDDVLMIEEIVLSMVVYLADG